ncbi:hypothetical protein D3C86_1714200 [compost metagenome]
MLMITRGNLIGDAADFKQRRLPFRLGHKGPDALQAHQQTFVSEFAQCAVNGHAAKAKLRHQLGLGGNAVVRLPDAGGDFFADGLFHLLIEGGRRTGWLIR